MQEFKIAAGEFVGHISEVGVAIPGAGVRKPSLPEAISVNADESLILHIGESGEVEGVSICSTLDIDQFAKDTAKMMADKLTYDDGE